jgi:hypothetical protein
MNALSPILNEPARRSTKNIDWSMICGVGRVPLLPGSGSKSKSGHRSSILKRRAAEPPSQHLKREKP